MGILNMETDILLFLGSQICVAGSIYGSIRSDLKSMMRQCHQLEVDVNEAHKRIDSILLKK